MSTWVISDYAYLEFINPQQNSDKFYELYLITTTSGTADYVVGARHGRRGANGQRVQVILTNSRAQAAQAFNAKLLEKQNKGYLTKASPSTCTVMTPNNQTLVLPTHGFVASPPVAQPQNDHARQIQLKALAVDGPASTAILSLFKGDGWFVPLERVQIARASLVDLTIPQGMELAVLVDCLVHKNQRIDVTAFHHFLPPEEIELCRIEQLDGLKP